MIKTRLDNEILNRGLAISRSQAEDLVKRGQVKLNNIVVQKASTPTSVNDKINILQSQQYVSRAALKLKSVSEYLGLDFKGKTVLDIGSSTGGFTQYALEQGASKVYSVDVGSGQLHPLLHGNKKIELHEKTDFRNFKPSSTPDIILADVSFISLQEILPHAADISSKSTKIVAMCKPQFEAGRGQTNKGVIKNSTVRRKILQEFEAWLKTRFLVLDKQDSGLAGSKGNVERFYSLRVLK